MKKKKPTTSDITEIGPYEWLIQYAEQHEMPWLVNGLRLIKDRINNMTSKENMQLITEVTKFVEQNEQEANNTSMRCVDGRDNQAGYIAVPGGHLGLPMALSATGIKPGFAYEMAKNFAFSGGENLGFHSDSHADHKEDFKCGCGHCYAANQDLKGFGFANMSESPSKVMFDQALQDMKTNPDLFNFVSYQQDHAEKAVLVVTDESFTVNHLGEDGTQYFVYDQARYHSYIRKFVAWFNQHSENGDDVLDADEVIKVADAQAMATLSRLESSQGKPIVLVSKDEAGQFVILQSAEKKDQKVASTPTQWDYSQAA